MEIKDYADYIDVAFKFVGIFVALYIAPIKKAIAGIESKMDGMEKSINKLNQNVAIMFEKHDLKDKQIEVLEKEMTRAREKLHDLGNKAALIDLNKMRLDKIEEKK